MREIFRCLCLFLVIQITSPFAFAVPANPPSLQFPSEYYLESTGDAYCPPSTYQQLTAGIPDSQALRRTVTKDADFSISPGYSSSLKLLEVVNVGRLGDVYSNPLFPYQSGGSQDLVAIYFENRGFMDGPFARLYLWRNTSSAVSTAPGAAVTVNSGTILNFDPLMTAVTGMRPDRGTAPAYIFNFGLIENWGYIFNYSEAWAENYGRVNFIGPNPDPSKKPYAMYQSSARLNNSGTVGTFHQNGGWTVDNTGLIEAYYDNGLGGLLVNSGTIKMARHDKGDVRPGRFDLYYNCGLLAVDSEEPVRYFIVSNSGTVTIKALKTYWGEDWYWYASRWGCWENSGLLDARQTVLHGGLWLVNSGTAFIKIKSAGGTINNSGLAVIDSEVSPEPHVVDWLPYQWSPEGWAWTNSGTLLTTGWWRFNRQPYSLSINNSGYWRLRPDASGKHTEFADITALSNTGLLDIGGASVSNGILSGSGTMRIDVADLSVAPITFTQIDSSAGEPCFEIYTTREQPDAGDITVFTVTMSSTTQNFKLTPEILIEDTDQKVQGYVLTAVPKDGNKTAWVLKRPQPIKTRLRANLDIIRTENDAEP